MNKMTQLNFVKSELKNKGMISRNACLKPQYSLDTGFLLRLSARIKDLRDSGWVITTDNKLNGKGRGDCVYKLVSMPEEEEIA